VIGVQLNPKRPSAASRAKGPDEARKRIDILLVETGLFDSRAKARAAIEAGLVTADGKVFTKPARHGRETSRSSPRPPIPGWAAAR
jgi:hypothetical protein